MKDETYVFIAFSAQDRNLARRFADALEITGIKLWTGLDDIPLGADFRQVIIQGITSAAGLIPLLTKFGVSSSWVMEEMRICLHLGKPIYPVVVGDFPRLPDDISHVQVLALSENPSSSELAAAAGRIAAVFRDTSPATQTQVLELQRFASKLAEEGPRFGEQSDTEQASNSVFVVHGHQDAALNDLEQYLKSLDVRPLIMTRMQEPSLSLLQRFFTIAGQANFAVILLSADDYGASLDQYQLPDVGDKALKFRSRQNVILELGFFFGKLTWDRVIVLSKKPHKKWPDFEMPSDLHGMVTVPMDETDNWKTQVREKLKLAGFKLRETG
jgi:predicted nucleotide-binding protein